MLIDSAPHALHPPPAGFQHDAFVYTDEDDFVAQAAPFLRAGLAAGETVVAVLPEARNRLLRAALDGSADQVVFLDDDQLGRNPARIIPLWRNLLDQVPGVPLRGLGEPAYPGRTQAELDEAALHELLLPIAFEKSGPFHLRCLYAADVTLDPTGLHARPESPAVRPSSVDPWDGRPQLEAAEAFFRTPLPEPPAGAQRRDFGLTELTGIRHWVNAMARAQRVPAERIEDLELALHEICTNSIRFGGGQGRLTVWTADGSLICEVADKGHLDDLLIGRVLPPVDGLGGRGVWLANQLCDLVQIRSGDHGTQVRLHTRLPAAAR